MSFGHYYAADAMSWFIVGAGSDGRVLSGLGF